MKVIPVLFSTILTIECLKRSGNTAKTRIAMVRSCINVTTNCNLLYDFIQQLLLYRLLSVTLMYTEQIFRKGVYKYILGITSFSKLKHTLIVPEISDRKEKNKLVKERIMRFCYSKSSLFLC